MGHSLCPQEKSLRCKLEREAKEALEALKEKQRQETEAAQKAEELAAELERQQQEQEEEDMLLKDKVYRDSACSKLAYIKFSYYMWVKIMLRC